MGKTSDWNAGTYHSALAYLQGRNFRPYTGGRATSVVKRLGADGPIVAIRYHNTDVVSYFPDFIMLQTDGYYTVTTKARFNETLKNLPGHVSVYQHKNVWYVHFGLRSEEDSITLEYYDRIKIGYDGLPYEYDSIAAETASARVKELSNKITKYCREVREVVEFGDVPKPSGGDCWGCLFGLGEETEHLELHMDEGYIHGTLLMKAVENPYMKYELGLLMEDQTVRSRKMVAVAVQKSLRRYLRKAFGLP